MEISLSESEESLSEESFSEEDSPKERLRLKMQQTEDHMLVTKQSKWGDWCKSRWSSSSLWAVKLKKVTSVRGRGNGWSRKGERGSWDEMG